MADLPDCRVIELRQYTLHRGRRAELIALFEAEFIETQEAAGLKVLGIFEDVGHPDRFVWLRGFADMASRGRGLPAFYGGPVWQAHRDAANATMVDSDDVLLLRPLTALPQPQEAGRWQALIAPLTEAPDAALIAALRAHGGCWFETEPAENNYPRLPVRRGETVVVGLAPGAVVLPPALQSRLAAPVRILKLNPTRRSPLR